MKRIWLWIIVITVTSSLLSTAESRRLTFEDMFSAGRLSSLCQSPDGKWLAFAVRTPSLTENSYRTDIYVVDINGEGIRKLTDSKGNNFSPQFLNNREVAFVSTRGASAQLFSIDILSRSEAKPLPEVAGGIGSYILNPNGKGMAFQADVYADAGSLAASRKREKEAADTGPDVKVLSSLMYRVWNYWKDGKRSHIFSYNWNNRSISDLTPGDYDTPPLDLGGRQDFLFSPDGKRFVYVKNLDEMVAVSTNNDIFVKDLASGKETNLTGGNRGNDMNPVFSSSGKLLAYLSMKRAGFEADKKDIILFDFASNSRKNLTESFTYNVNELVFSKDETAIYFSVTESVFHPLYRVNLKNGKIEKIIHKVFSSNLNITPEGRYLVFFNQTARFPNEVFRWDLRRKQLTQLTYHNKKVLAGIEINPAERFQFSGAGADRVEGIIIKPPHFDPKRKYPMVFLVHGGPQGAWGDDFHFRWNMSLFAAPGYVVVAINFHGSRGYGQTFTDAVSRDWGGAPYRDLVLGQQYVVETYPFIDKDKIVAAGASYGGFMVNWMAGHSDDFKYPFQCLVSHDGIFDARSMYYSTEELWFEEWEYGGPPWQSDLYEKFNPANYVENFKVPMLIIHGQQDFRVPVSQGFMLFTALQRRGVKSKMLYFPNEDHFVQKPKNARFWWKSVHDWFREHIED